MSSQFGAFPFGARQFDACQFDTFHFDAVPVRHVSLWRDASLARFTLAHFPFLCLTAQKCFLPTPVWHVSRFAPMLIEYASMVCSTHSIYICWPVSFLRRSVFFMRVSLFCIFFLCVSRIISLLILSTCHRGYTIADLFISRLRLQNGCATQRDVCEHISIQIRSVCGDTISGPLNVFEQLYLKRTVTDTINWLAVKQ